MPSNCNINGASRLETAISAHSIVKVSTAGFAATFSGSGNSILSPVRHSGALYQPSDLGRIMGRGSADGFDANSCKVAHVPPFRSREG